LARRGRRWPMAKALDAIDYGSWARQTYPMATPATSGPCLPRTVGSSSARAKMTRNRKAHSAGQAWQEETAASEHPTGSSPEATCASGKLQPVQANGARLFWRRVRAIVPHAGEYPAMQKDRRILIARTGLERIRVYSGIAASRAAERQPQKYEEQEIGQQRRIDPSETRRIVEDTNRAPQKSHLARLPRQTSRIPKCRAAGREADREREVRYRKQMQRG